MLLTGSLLHRSVLRRKGWPARGRPLLQRRLVDRLIIRLAVRLTIYRLLLHRPVHRLVIRGLIVRGLLLRLLVIGLIWPTRRTPNRIRLHLLTVLNRLILNRLILNRLILNRLILKRLTLSRLIPLRIAAPVGEAVIRPGVVIIPIVPAIVIAPVVIPIPTVTISVISIAAIPIIPAVVIPIIPVVSSPGIAVTTIISAIPTIIIPPVIDPIPTIIIPPVIIPIPTIVVPPVIIPVPIDHPVDRSCIPQRLNPGRSKMTTAGSRISRPVLRHCTATDTGTIDGKIPVVRTIAGIAPVPDRYRPYRCTGIPSYLIGIRSGAIMDIPGIVNDSRIIDDRSPVDNGDVIRLPDIVIIYLRTGDIPVRNKTPVVRRRSIAATVSSAIAEIGAHRRPAIVIVAVAPAHPGGSPLVAGYPHPAIAVLEVPAAIVKSSPAPGIAGIPGPALIGIDPVPIGGIGLEIRADVRQPNVSVVRVVDPLPIRTQVVIKILVCYLGRIGLRRRRQRRRSRRRRRILVYHIDRATCSKANGHEGQNIQVLFHKSAFELTIGHSSVRKVKAFSRL